MAFLIPIAAEMATGAAYGGGFAAAWYGMQKLFGQDEVPEEKEQTMNSKIEAELEELKKKHEEDAKRWKDQEQREKDKKREEYEKAKKDMKRQMDDYDLMKKNAEAEMKKYKQMKDDEKRKADDEIQKQKKEMKRMNDEIKKQKEEMERKMAEIEEEQKKPPNEQKAFKRYVEAVSKTGVTPLYATHPDIFRIGFLGNVSVGKSSLINALYGKKVAKAGHGQTTLKPTFVGEMKLTMVTETKVHIYDIPGDDSDYSYADVKALRLVNSLDLLVVVFDNTISYTYKALELAKAFGKYIIFVRNKLDNIESSNEDNDEDDDDNNEELTWQEELEKDKKHLAKMFPTSVQPPLFGVSARNALKAVKAALTSGHKAATQYEVYQWNEFMKELIHLSEADRNDSAQAGGEVCHNDVRDRP